MVIYSQKDSSKSCYRWFNAIELEEGRGVEEIGFEKDIWAKAREYKW